MKIQMESLLNGKTIEVNFDEQIVFSHLAQDESAVWSLLVAGGYLKVEDVDAMNYCMNKITLATFSYFESEVKALEIRNRKDFIMDLCLD